MKTNKAFTLIELLVVISIIAMLLAILMPALGAVKEQAKKVVCSAHMRGMGTAVLLYGQDNDDKFPEMKGGFARQNATYYYTYSHIPTHSSNYPGPSGLGHLWKSGYLDKGTELAFCPSMKSMFGGSPLPSRKWNSKGDVEHWNYVGPGSSNNYLLRPEDSGMGWINMRITIGMRNMSGLGIKKFSDASAKGKRAFISDLWAADPTGAYWKTREEDIQHQTSGKK